MAAFAKKYKDFDMSEPEKIVLVGESLTTDILFGNMNQMATVWINGLWHRGNIIGIDDKELLEIEKTEGNKIMKEKSMPHKGFFKSNLQESWVLKPGEICLNMEHL